MWVTGLLCLPLETELVNIPPNKGNNRAYGQNLAVLSTGLKVWWPSHTNVIIIRTSQHCVGFPHPPHVHSIEWIFSPQFSPFLSLYFPFSGTWCTRENSLQQNIACQTLPFGTVLLGLSESWFQVIVGLQCARP